MGIVGTDEQLVLLLLLVSAAAAVAARTAVLLLLAGLLWSSYTVRGPAVDLKSTYAIISSIYELDVLDIVKYLLDTKIMHVFFV